MDCTIKIFPAGCGDAIAIRYWGDDEKYHNIFIDGGYKATYTDYLKSEISTIAKNSEIIDIWCITHVDNDHINGWIAFLEDKTNFKDGDGKVMSKEELVGEYWFNYTSLQCTSLTVISEEQTETKVEEGIKLRDYLVKTGKLIQKDIIASPEPIKKYGASFTFLAPSETDLNDLKAKWEGEEKAMITTTSGEGKNDHDISFEELQAKLLKEDIFEEDAKVFNKSSIAFIWEYKGVKILFLGDAVPSTVTKALKDLGCDNTSKKLKVNYVKISHHGSKKNTNNELLDLIDCQNFIICMDGYKYGLPDKEALVRILIKQPKARFIFSATTKFYDGIFSPEEKTTYAIKPFGYCHKGNPITLNFSAK